MENTAAALQTMYRQAFATEIANGTDIISSKSFQRARGPFTLTDLRLTDIEQIDDPQRV